MKQLIYKIIVLIILTININYGLEGTVTNVTLPSTLAPQKYGFVMYKPVNYDTNTNSYPLVVGLHGVSHDGDGSDASLNSKIRAIGLMKATLKGRDIGAIVVTPQANKGMNNGYFDPNAVGDFIKYCKATYRVDDRRVILTGFSAGAGTTMQMVYFKGGRAGVCAAVPIAVSLNTSIGMNTEPQRIARMPLWFVHNFGDGSVTYKNSVAWCNYITSYQTGVTTSCMSTYPNENGDLTKPATSHKTGSLNGGSYIWNSGVIPGINYPEFTLRNATGHNSWDDVYQSDYFWTWVLSRQNAVPTVSDIVDQKVKMNTALDIKFNIDDADMVPVRLAITKTSSNLSLIPTANIIVTGVTSERNLNIVPTKDKIGSSTITITVSDGISSISDSFVVTVE